MSNFKKRTIKGFTLVELITVITILTILGTIAFISFEWYTKKSRDGNRVATLWQVAKGIEIFKLATGTVPMVDNQVWTGTISGIGITYVGSIGDNVARLIHMSNRPIDPATKWNYAYGIDVSNTKFQIGTITEDLQTSIIVPKVHADGGVKANVLWNYNGLLKYSGKIYNIPSLLITFSGSSSQDLLAGTTNYVIDKWENLPYLAWGATQLNTLTPTQVLQKITNSTTNLVVTWGTIPVDKTSWVSQNGLLEINLWHSKDAIWLTAFWDTYYSNIMTPTTNEKYFEFDIPTKTILSYSWAWPKDVIIPTKIWGVPVENIWTWAFSTLFDLTSVVIPEWIKTIQNWAFQNNGNLTTIVIPNTVTTIGDWAFMNAGTTGHISSVTLWNNVIIIWIWAFRWNLITNIAIPNSVTTLSNFAFTSNNLTSVVIPSSVTSIGTNAFQSNGPLKNSGTITYSVWWWTYNLSGITWVKL